MNNSGILDRIRIVLVGTSHPGNIGASARAMKNMGLTQLVLVNPLEFPSDQAVWRAVGAADLLEKARVVSSLDEAVADCSLVIGTSARGRRIPWPVFEPRRCAERVAEESPDSAIAIVFGGEKMGLSNDDLHRCNYHLTIPVNPEYSSLNLGAAVQVVCYELRMKQLELLKVETAGEMDGWDSEFCRADQMEHFYEHLEQTMIDVDFHDPDNPRQLMTRLRRLFSRTRLDKMELSILRGILTNTQRNASINAPQSNEQKTKDQ